MPSTANFNIAPCGCLTELEQHPDGIIMRLITANGRCDHAAQMLAYADEHNIPVTVKDT